MSVIQTPADRIVSNLAEHREDLAELAERDDHLGALGRIALAIANGEDPDPDDCEQAGLPVLIDIVEDGL